MLEDEMWLKFLNSGKIEDYLEYNEARIRQHNLAKQVETVKGLDAYAGLGLGDEGANLHAGNDNGNGDGDKSDSYR